MLSDLITRNERERDQRIARETRKANDKLRRRFISRIGRDVWDALENRCQVDDVAIHFTYQGKPWRIEPYVLGMFKLMPDEPKPGFGQMGWLTWESTIENREGFLHELNRRTK